MAYSRVVSPVAPGLARSTSPIARSLTRELPEAFRDARPLRTTSRSHFAERNAAGRVAGAILLNKCPPAEHPEASC